MGLLKKNAGAGVWAKGSLGENKGTELERQFNCHKYGTFLCLAFAFHFRFRLRRLVEGERLAAASSTSTSSSSSSSSLSFLVALDLAQAAQIFSLALSLSLCPWVKQNKGVSPWQPRGKAAGGSWDAALFFVTSWSLWVASMTRYVLCLVNYFILSPSTLRLPFMTCRTTFGWQGQPLFRRKSKTSNILPHIFLN